MQVALTPETSARFRSYSEGFVQVCHERGLTAKQAAELLEAHLPAFIATRSEHGRAGAAEAIKAATTLAAPVLRGAGRMLKNVTPALERAAAPAMKQTINGVRGGALGSGLMRGLRSPLTLGAIGLTGVTDNPISDALPSWANDIAAGVGFGGLGGRLLGQAGRMGARAGTAMGATVGGAGGMARSFFKHQYPVEMDAAGWSPDYVDPSNFSQGNRIGISNSSAGRGLDRARREMAALEQDMAAIDVRAGNSVGNALQRRLALAEKADLQRRHAALSRQVGQQLAGIQRDQGRLQAEGATRLQGVNTALGNLTDDEAAMERAFARSERGGFGGLFNELWLRASGANSQAAELVARRRALENAQRIEQNRSTAQLLPSGWDS